MNKKIANVVKDILAESGLDLYDIKFEYGRLEGSDEIVLIDEVSGGNMRAYKDGKCRTTWSFKIFKHLRSKNESINYNGVNFW